MAGIREEIIRTPEELARCCSELANSTLLGLDTEFVGEQTYHPRLCLVQVAVPDCLYLIDPLSAGPLDAFWKLLQDPARLVVVHAGREEVRLCRLWSGYPPARLFDLQLAAGLVTPVYPIGHGPLVNRLLQTRLNKGETLTEWRRRPLTDEQIRYAFDDVRYLLPAYQKLHERLEKLGRLTWAEEEFERLIRSASPEIPGQEERWRKLKGVGALDRRKLAVVKALYEWREERAAKVNRPARTVVRDDLLVEVAKRNPSRVRDLQVVRGLQPRELESMVEVVQQARRLSLEECPEPTPREIDTPQHTLVSGILIAVLGHLCARMELATSLAANNSDIRLLVRARMAGQDIPSNLVLTQGWRAKHILPELLAVLEGRRAIRITGLQSESPLELIPTSGQQK